MPADRLLTTLLRSLQTYTDQQDTPRLLATASSLLTTLHNPLNITLLTYQLLTAPAIWERPAGLHTSLRVLGVFHSAAIQVLKREDEALEQQAHYLWPSRPPLVEGIPKDEWVTAVIKGADERSLRWRHLLVLGGLLIGFGPQENERLPHRLRSSLEQGFVQAVNFSLVDVRNGDELGAQSIALCLNHTFPFLSVYERNRLDYDLLLPVLVGSAFFSNEGLQSAYFLAAIDLDIVLHNDNKLSWPSHSTSAHQIDRIFSRPLISSLGPLSRLISHSVENVRDPWLVQTVIEDLTGFSKSLLMQWRHSKLSQVEAAKEAEFLTEETSTMTSPKLWKLLKSALFGVIIVLRGAMGRLLGDGSLAADAVAPVIVCQTLHTLRNLYFITARLGVDSYVQYTFVYLTAIDILSRYPIQADAFLKEIGPKELGHIPESSLEQTLDLYFLNTAEHFTLVLSPSTNEDLLVAASSPYLAAGGNAHLLPIFEAAHSVMLAVMSAPQSVELTAKHMPFYIDALFRVFPDNLSPRQFRLAFKTLLRVLAPPSMLTATHPDFPATLLELLHHRALHAPTVPLRKSYPSQPDALLQPQLSEQAVLILTLLDALPHLQLALLQEWLPLAAALLHVIPSAEMRSACVKRFWDVMVGGEMDPERAQVCVAWWTTRGGREQVLRIPRELAI